MAPDSVPYSFRLEAIIPFSSQEEQGHRPSTHLLGIAAGPIQGREKNLDGDGFESLEKGGRNRGRQEKWRGMERQRRYRVMLTYFDSTILSYEIGRTQNGGGFGDDVLVV